MAVSLASIDNQADLLEHGRKVARNRFRVFASRLTGWKLPQHQVQICDALEEVEKTEGARLIITMPPRHGKSEIGTIAFPTYCLARGAMGFGPIQRVAIAAYGADLAVKFCATCRDHFMDPQDAVNRIFPGLRLIKKSDNEWRLWPAPANRPSCIGVGVGGPFTGKGADLIIIDDPVKTRQDAESQLKRDRIWDWYTYVARTRMQKGGRIVVIMTRWHEDDLAGRLIAQGGWKVLHLKALDDDGQALWPDAYPAEELQRIRYEMGDQGFQALYQGEPTASQGSIWQKHWFDDNAYQQPEQVPKLDKVFTAWDTAFKTGQADDYTAWCTMGVDNKGDLWCLDVGHDRLEFPDLVKAIELGNGRPITEAAIVEDKASGTSAIQTIKTKCRRPIIPVQPDRDKEARARAVTYICDAGKVHFPKHHKFFDALVNECTSFPHGMHDDMMDSLVYALQYGLDYLQQAKQSYEVLWV